MGSSFAEAKLEFFHAMVMNTTVYAGAAQLATVDLMKLNAALAVVIVTGLIINMRFLLYSVAMAPFLKNSSGWIKFICAFSLTDQSYAAMISNQDKFETDKDAVDFYLGTATCMLITWHSAVIAGYVFGNFAPSWLSLDFAIPLSFIALLVPTLKTKSHVTVAFFSGVSSIFFYSMPLRTGLMVTALLSIALGWFFVKRKT